MLVETEQDYRAMLKGLSEIGDSTLAVDTETTGLAMYAGDTITGIGVAYYRAGNYSEGIESWYLPVNHAGGGARNRSPQRLLRAIERHRGLSAWHNANGVDWAGLTQLGMRKLPAQFHDTQVMAWLMNENAHHGLKEQHASYFGSDALAEKKALKALMKGGKTWADLTTDDIAAYADQDPVLTLELMDVQVGPTGSKNPSLAREHRIQQILFEMIQTGIRVDPVKCRAQLADAEERHAELAAKFEGVNLRSPKQLGALVYDDWGVECRHFTDGGARSTAREALEEMEWDERISDLMDYRRLDKAITGYYRPYVHFVDSDGRIHPSFSSTRTKTGRFACSLPNLQTIPRGDTLEGVRDLFIADDGSELWEYDLSSAELCVMMSWAGEAEVVEGLLRGVQPHDDTARSIFGPSYTPLQRRVAKNVNYGAPYYIGPRKCAKYIVKGTGKPVTECSYWSERDKKKRRKMTRCHACTVCEAAVILQGWEATYPRLTRLRDGLTREARKDGYLPLHVEGRYRHFRAPGSPNQAYYTALNGLVQGGIGEFMKDMMIQFWTHPVMENARLCLQVHDSFVFEVAPGFGPKVGAVLQEITNDINPFDMPMRWDQQEWSQHD